MSILFQPKLTTEATRLQAKWARERVLRKIWTNHCVSAAGELVPEFWLTLCTSVAHTHTTKTEIAVFSFEPHVFSITRVWLILG